MPQQVCPSEFTKTIDEIVECSQDDKELEEGIKWVDHAARMKKMSFYDMCYEILYKYDVNSKARKWLKTKNG